MAIFCFLLGVFVLALALFFGGWLGLFIALGLGICYILAFGGPEDVTKDYFPPRRRR